MKFKEQTKTEQILAVMRILAWVAFVGYMIEAGAILFSYVFSIINPEAARNLYKGLNLYNLREFNFWHYALSITFTTVLPVLNSVTAFLVIKTLTKLNMSNPFTMEVATKLERISYVIFAAWVVKMTHNGHLTLLKELTGEVHGNWMSGEFIFIAGVVYVFSQIFKRGVELQSENELTV